jgi:hypothetical protein
MTTIWKYKERTINIGQRWVDDHGTRHPKNWMNWTEEEKVQKEVKEYVCDPEPDSRLYVWSMDTWGKITKTERALDDDGDVLGVKSNLKNTVKNQQKSILSQTDSWIIRKADKGTAVPSNIQTWRDAIRAKAKEMEDAIESASDTAGIVALWVVHDEDGNKSGILYDWPELVE